MSVLDALLWFERELDADGIPTDEVRMQLPSAAFRRIVSELDKIKLIRRPNMMPTKEIMIRGRLRITEIPPQG